MRQSILLSIIGMALYLSLTTYAGTYSGGDGSAGNPYQVANKTDLLTLAATTEDYGQCFILTADIDLDPNLPEGQVFTTTVIAPDTSLGSSGFQGTTFTGVFDGNGHKIRNLTIAGGGSDYVGLFGYVGSGGQIKNLGVVNCNIQGRDYVGRLAGDSYYGMITSCYATGSVSGNDYVGGLVGGYSGTITSCYATGSVSGNYYVGGLVGSNCGTITSCYATETVSGYYYVGGLVGGNFGGTISSCYVTDSVSGTGIVGGLCGKNCNSGTISFCYATGSVSESVWGAGGVGGLVGENGQGTISFCYATGSVSGSSRVGGLCGNNNNSGTISSCYAMGSVSGSSRVGGLCGYQTGSYAKMQNSFWDTNTSGLTAGYNLDSSSPGTIINVVGKTTTQMQTLSTFTDAGWDFTNTDGDAADWFMSGIEYPHLICETMAIIPDVVGMMQEDARAALAAVNFQIKNTYIASDTIPAGKVIIQSPAGGVEIPCGATITLTVSLGVKYMGSGTEADPYQITTKYEFLIFATMTADYSKYSILMADIDLAGDNFTTAVIAPDTSLGSSGFQGTPFTGVFDGNGHKISNLTIAGSRCDYVGLFGYVDSGGRIKNLGVVNVTIQGCFYVGGLVGDNYGKITACYATGTVSGTGNNSVGGLVGVNSDGTISSCYATGVVSGYISVGGLVGDNGRGTITTCYAMGTVIGTGSSVGGLVGGNGQGTITTCYATGAVSGSHSVGGLVGVNSEGTITTCYAMGAVSGSSYVGGLCGSQYGSYAKTQNSFWDIETSGRTTGYNLDYFSPGTIINVVGKTTAQMQTLSTFTDAGWDFTNTDGDAADWFMSGIEYPHLICETTAILPDVVGMMQQDAKAALAAVNFQIKNIYIASDTIPAGKVIIQSPAGGTEIPCGSMITLTISAGAKYMGSGTEADPYQITTQYEFQIFATMTADYSKYFILTTDIDLAGDNFTAAVIAPDTDSVSSGFQGTQFTGVFNGNGHKISNLAIAGGGSDYVGLFGNVGSGGRIKNLGVVNATRQGRNSVGGLVGYNAGTISSCYTTGSVSGSAWGTGNNSVGGLVGINSVGTITTCYATDSVSGSGSGSVGGLVGYNSGMISFCYATGTVSGYYYVGGLVGQSYYGTVRYSFWDTQTSGCTASAGGISKTTAQMKTLSTFTSANWDFINIWAICEGMNYPRLRWQIPASDWVCPGGVAMEDFSYLSQRWLRADCAVTGHCEGADLNLNGTVDVGDLILFAGYWLAQ